MLTKNTQGYVFQLLEFNTDKSQYLINETLSIHTKWNHYIGEDEEGFLRLEILTIQGICLNQSRDYYENGFEIENSYIIELKSLNLVPQSDPLTLDVTLHFFVRDKYTGVIDESFDTRSIQVVFFNLTYSYSFTNSTNLCFSDPIQLIVNFWERDFDHFKASNLNLSYCVENAQDQILFIGILLTNYQGTANLSLITENLPPGSYNITLTSNSSTFFNPIEIKQNFIVFPGNLIICTRFDPIDAVISIPEENIFSENSLYVDIWFKAGWYSIPELELNWTLLDFMGYFQYLGNLTFYSPLTPLSDSGEYKIEINGSSPYFESFNISPKITVLKREVTISATIDDTNQRLSLKAFDLTTNRLLSLSLLGKIEVYEIDPEGSSKRITYEIHNNTIIISPSFLPEKLEGYKIVIYIEESQCFSFFSKTISSNDFFLNPSNNSFNLLIYIVLVVSLPGIIIFSYFHFNKNRKKKGFSLKRLRFEI